MENKLVSYHDDRVKKYRFWNALRILKEDFEQTNQFNSFEEWIKTQYGFEIILALDNHSYSSDHIIIDSKKHLLFQLRFGLM